jgi:hypothetical protein
LGKSNQLYLHHKSTQKGMNNLRWKQTHGTQMIFKNLKVGRACLRWQAQYGLPNNFKPPLWRNYFPCHLVITSKRDLGFIENEGQMLNHGKKSLKLVHSYVIQRICIWVIFGSKIHTMGV